MKYLLLLLCSASLFIAQNSVFAQAPALFNYQGIARDINGNPLSNQTLTLKISVLPTSDAAVAEYEETQSVKTNEFGLYTLQIGNGTVLTGTMKTVTWETGNKYIKVAIDPNGGTNYVDAGTSQLLSVPYAIYADKAGVATNAGNDKTRTGAVNSNAAHVAGDANYLTKFTALNTIGKSVLYESATGKIGLGTAAPGGNFSLYTAAAGVVEHIRMQDVTPTGAGRFVMYNNNASAYATFTKYGTTYAGGYPGVSTLYPHANLLAFGNNGSVANDGTGRFLISSGGNIGISISKGGMSLLKFHADFSTENVGIGGNASPVNRVHLNNTSGTDMTVGITNNTSGHLANDGLVIRENNNDASIINMENSSLVLGTNNTTNLSILSNGNVGIGNLAPVEKLEIAGNAKADTVKTNVLTVTPNAVAGKVLTSDASGNASWQTAPGPTAHYIGESYGGGIVFFVYDNGTHGLIAATADQNAGAVIRWWGGSYTNTKARADGVGAGLKNTAIIVANQGPVDGNALAASICNEYFVNVGGVTYGDWYLPSKYELNLLYLQKNTVGGFANGYYWSSSELITTHAYVIDFATGGQFFITKDLTHRIRAIRSF